MSNILHIFPAPEGWSLLDNEMKTIIPRNLSINLLTNEIRKFESATVLIYKIGHKFNEYELDVVIGHSKKNPFDPTKMI